MSVPPGSAPTGPPTGQAGTARPRRRRGPGKDELAAAHGATVPDILAPDLDILFCGINPGLYSGWSGHHFARPGNRFWPALHQAGLTPRQLSPDEQRLLPDRGLGITNLVARSTARADELGTAELRGGAAGLERKLRAYRPRVLAVLGVTAFRQAFGDPAARIGPSSQPIADTPVQVLPNPSGLNAHWSTADIAEELRRLGEFARGRTTGSC